MEGGWLEDARAPAKAWQPQGQAPRRSDASDHGQAKVDLSKRERPHSLHAELGARRSCSAPGPLTGRRT